MFVILCKCCNVSTKGTIQTLKWYSWATSLLDSKKEKENSSSCMILLSIKNKKQNMNCLLTSLSWHASHQLAHFSKLFDNFQNEFNCIVIVFIHAKQHSVCFCWSEAVLPKILHIALFYMKKKSIHF